MNPDEQVAFSQISFYEAKTWHYYRCNIAKEADKKSKSMSMAWTEASSIEFEQFSGFHQEPRQAGGV